MTPDELAALIAAIRKQVYTWCGGEAIEAVERLIRFAEQAQAERQRRQRRDRGKDQER